MKKVTVEVDLKTKNAQRNIDKLNQSVDNTSKELNQTKGSLDGVSNVADRATGGMLAGFNGVIKSVGGLIKGLGSLKMALIATGIGAVVLAVGALNSAFKSSEEGQDKFNKKMGEVNVVLDNMTDVLADFGEDLIEAFENPKQTWNSFVDSLTSGAKKIKSNLIDQVTGQFEFMGAFVQSQIAKMRIAINKWTGDTEKVALLQKELRLRNAEMSLGVIKMNKAVEEANDAVKETYEDIQQAALEWNAEQEREIKLAGEVADMRAKADRVERKLLVDRSKKESEIALLRLKARQEDEFSAEERKQALLEAQKLEDELLAAESKALNLRKAAIIQENKFSRTNKENKDKEAQAIAEVNRLVARRANIARTLQRELNTINNQIAAEEKAKADLEKKLLDEKIKREDDLFTFLNQRRETQQQKEITSLVEQYEKAYLLAENNNELERQLAEQQAQDIQKINDKYRKIEEDKQRQDLIRERANQQAKVKMAGDALGAIGNFITAFAKEDEESQRKAFNLNKAVSIAQALVNTSLAVTAALTAGGNPVKLATGAQFVEAGIAAVMGAAQVATIAKTQFQGSSASTPSAPSGGFNGETGATTQPAAFNVVGQSGFNQVATALGEQPPIKTFVVSQDVTTAQQLNNAIVQTAKF